MSDVYDIEFLEHQERRLGMSLALIKGQQDLSLNAHKLLRLAIMQNRFTKDGDLKEYRITVSEFAKVLDIDPSNVYREADRLTEEIMRQVVKMGDPSHPKSWVKFNWVHICRYDHKNQEIRIKLHDELKPHLRNLSRNYLQYEYGEMIYMKSTYGIRLYELIRGKAGYEGQKITTGKFAVELSIAHIRMACGLGNKYKQIGELKKRVIDAGIKAINESSNWKIIGYENGKKKGRTVMTIRFWVTTNMEFMLSQKGRTRARQYLEWKLAQGFIDKPVNDPTETMDGQEIFNLD